MKTFDGVRFLKFLRFEFLSRSAVLFPAFLVPSALYAMWALWQIQNGQVVEAWGEQSFRIGLLLGIGTALNAHWLENNPNTASFHLMLPVSQFEKFLARWVLSFGLCFFGQMILLTILAIGFGMASTYYFGKFLPTFIFPGAELIQRAFLTFFVAHSIFFAGGVFFKRNPWGKTIWSVVAYGFMLFAFTLVFVKAGIVSKIVSRFEFGAQFEGLGEAFLTTHWILAVAWMVIFPLLLYVAAFYRTCENEVRG